MWKEENCAKFTLSSNIVFKKQIEFGKLTIINVLKSLLSTAVNAMFVQVF